MNRIVIFSGTTEGRMLAQTLSENEIHCIVSVATEYGESVMPEMDGVTVHKGRMDLEEMQKFITQSEVAAVVDATHPFATAVSENIRESLKNTEIPYIRLQRETSDIALNKDTIQENRSDVILCSDATECADFLSSTDGNILLTTGSKDLATYSQNEALKDRLFVRVLPGLESISLCEQNGICGKQIIAMQGPFSLEMNRALIRQFDIKYLVTKESGRTGGFLEKIKAAGAEGITACVIGNPEKQNSGDTFTQVCRKISEITGKTIKNQIFLIGTGMGNAQTLTMEAAEKIREADCIFGAERLLRIIKNEQAVRYPYYLAADIVPELDRLSGCGVKVVILFSGDTGFYSGCGKLYETLKGRSDSRVRIYPGISSVSYLAALTGYSYQDAAVLSIHGHGADSEWIGNLTETIRFSAKTFLLMSGKDIRAEELLQESIGKLRKELVDNFAMKVFPKEWVCGSLLVRQLHSLAEEGKHPSDELWLQVEKELALNEENFMEWLTNCRKDKKLKEREWRMCLLVKMCFLPVEMAVLLVTSKQNVSNMRSRLVQKIFGQNGRSGEFDILISEL